MRKLLVQFLVPSGLSPDYFFFKEKKTYVCELRNTSWKGTFEKNFNILWKFKGERIPLTKMDCGNLIWDLVKKYYSLWFFRAYYTPGIVLSTFNCIIFDYNKPTKLCPALGWIMFLNLFMMRCSVWDTGVGCPPFSDESKVLPKFTQHVSIEERN